MVTEISLIWNKGLDSMTISNEAFVFSSQNIHERDKHLK
jgi:hypothetical protein